MAQAYMVGATADGPLGWDHVEERLGGSRNYWIVTARPDGRPHAAPVWGVWVEGSLYFGTSRGSVKGRNLARRPELVVHLESGDDVVILEGVVEEVRDRAAFDDIDAAYRAKYGMGVDEAGDDGTGDDGTGDDGAVWYVVRPETAHAWLESDFLETATRWRFPVG